jgi:hypothetical protein
MELLCNFVWALVATASVYFWLKLGRRTPKTEHSSLVGLAMLAVILFPVISVSDDLWTLQNPAESDTCLRRDHRDGSFTPHLSTAAAVPEPIRTGLIYGSRRQELPRLGKLNLTDNPLLGFIENRPPPVF